MGGTYVFGEPLAELSDVRPGVARLGVAGDTFNTAIYMRRAGVPVRYVSVIGTDPLSAQVARIAEEEGIETVDILRSPDRPVGLYVIETDDAGERRFTYWRSNSAYRAWFATPGAEASLTRMAEADLLYLSGISLSAFDEERRQRIIQVAHDVRRAGGKVAFDPNYRPAGWESREAARGAISAIMPAVSIALPTFEDEAALFGYPSPERSLMAWQAAGAEEVCVKCGPRGALLPEGWVAPEAPRQPLDTTGAGDSFNAAYLAARSRGEDFVSAARAANALAGEVVMTRGAILPRPGPAPQAVA